MKRQERIKIAEETLNIFKEGFYTYQNSQINVSLLHKNCMEKVILLEENNNKMFMQPAYIYSQPALRQIKNQSVVDLIVHGQKVYGVLNFASAYHPGGGFLHGSLAQEEALCYGSNLYLTQIQYKQDFYDYHRTIISKCYSDRMIYSPNVVFIRDEKYQLLSQPMQAHILTSPAVNMGAALQRNEDERKCYDIMKKRMRKILSIFVQTGNTHIILGAFGCGVFRNDPYKIATFWRELLEEGWQYSFDEVIFAIYDTSPNQSIFQCFKNIL